MGLLANTTNASTIKMPESVSSKTADRGNSAVSSKAICKILRYPTLMGEQWKILPAAIQQRFLKWSPERKVTIYRGRLLETRFSFLGACLSSLCGIIGSPLPKRDNIRGPATVIVQENRQLDGQIWTRIYPRAGKVPQVIQSVKMFHGPTGLEEMISPYLGISLTLEAENDRLTFFSEQYFIRLFNKRLCLPGWASPGKLTITHKGLGTKRFRFTLELKHKILGELVYQTAIYEELEQ